MKRILFVGALLAIVLSLAACAAPTQPPATTAPTAAQPAAPQPTTVPATAVAPTAPPAQPTATQAPKTLIVARNMDTKTLDPERQYEIAPPMIIHAAYETLVTFGGGGQDITKIEPLLAEKYDISGDGLTYKFTLRKGVKFHSGNEMKAADVVFSFQRLGNLKDNPAWLFSDHVKDIKATGDYEVTVTLKEPNAAFLSILVSPNLVVIDSQTVKSKGGTDAPDADKTDKATDWLDQNSAGTGPYILKGWTRDVDITLVKNPNYWRAPAKLDRIVVRQVPDATTQFQALSKGDIDVAQNLDVDLSAQLKSSGKGQVVEGASLDIVYLAMTSNKDVSKELADQRVRQAISYAIDYDGIVSKLMKGNAIRLPSVIPVGLLGIDPASAPKTDLDKAKALMKDAGLEKGFSVKMVYGTTTFVGGLTAETVVTKLQADLAKIGVTLQLEPREVAQWRADYRAGKLPIVVADWTPDFPDPHGWAIPFAAKDGSAAKRVYYQNAQAEQLAVDAGHLTDPAKRADLYKQLNATFVSDANFIGLYQPKTLAGVGKDVTGYVFNPVWNVDYYNVGK